MMSKRRSMASAYFICRKRTMLFYNGIVPNFIDVVLLSGYNVLVILCVEVSPMA